MFSVAAEGIEVVGEARTHEGAVAAVLEERPDVVLLDLEMPGGMGADDAMGRMLESRMRSATCSSKSASTAR